MIEPERTEDFLERVRVRDNLGLSQLAGKYAPDGGDWRESAQRGMRALDCALHKVSIGDVDPRALLRRFDLPLTPGVVEVRDAFCDSARGRS
ncbi:hypothetical protein D3C73_1303830 [compost metagenome]